MALRSMTGFGVAEGDLSPRVAVSVRIVAVNGRFLDVVLRCQPRMDVTDLEPAVRATLGEGLTRGRVTVSIQLRRRDGGEAGLSLRWESAAALLRELERRPAGLELAPLSLRDLLALPGFAEGLGELALDEAERTALLGVIGEARAALVRSREEEAEALVSQIGGELTVLEGFTSWLETANVRVRDVLLSRLRERLGELLAGIAVPEDRLLVEAAIGADRADVAEEVARLGAHVAQARRLLMEGGAVGKRLEFVLQEILREVNTAASKCREAGLGERVVEAKAAVEKLREQIANLE